MEKKIHTHTHTLQHAPIWNETKRNRTEPFKAYERKIIELKAIASFVSACTIVSVVIDIDIDIDNSKMVNEELHCYLNTWILEYMMKLIYNFHWVLIMRQRIKIE